METKNINALLETVKTLRSENGCEWDRAQTYGNKKYKCTS